MLYHDDIKGYRFNTWYDSNKKFYGGERIDDPVEELQAFWDEEHLWEAVVPSKHLDSAPLLPR